MSFQTYAGMVEWFQRREANNYTTDILVDGPRGAGKSNVTHLTMEKLKPGFDFELHYVYDAGDLARIMGRAGGMDNLSMWFDEAKNVAYRRNAITNVNKSVSTLLTQIREKRGTRFWVTPDVGELEGFLTKDQCDVCLTVPSRGKLSVWRFWKNYHTPPGTREGRWLKAFDREGIPNLETLLPDRAVLYRRFKTAGFNRVSGVMGDKIAGRRPRKEPRATKKALIVAALASNPKATPKEIAALVGTTPANVRYVRSVVAPEGPIVT